MEKLILNTFEKDKNFEWSNNYIIALILVLVYILSWISNHFFNSKFESIIILLGIVFIISILYLKITSYSKRRRLHGKFIGKLYFTPDSIFLNNIELSLKDIDIIRFDASDYEGSLISIYGFDGNLSNGTDNIIEIKLKNSTKIKSQFQLNYENQLWKIEEILVYYCKLKKLNYYNLLNILNLEDYDQIQNFKKKHGLTSP